MVPIETWLFLLEVIMKTISKKCKHLTTDFEAVIRDKMYCRILGYIGKTDCEPELCSHYEPSILKNKQDDTNTYVTTRKLTVFQYQLMRDKLTCGEVEKLVRECEIDGVKKYTLSNQHLARYACELSDRLIEHY